VFMWVCMCIGMCECSGSRGCKNRVVEKISPWVHTQLPHPSSCAPVMKGWREGPRPTETWHADCSLGIGSDHYWNPWNQIAGAHPPHLPPAFHVVSVKVSTWDQWIMSWIRSAWYSQTHHCLTGTKVQKYLDASLKIVESLCVDW